MTFNAEILLKGHGEVVEEVIHRDGPEPADWTDEDVREVLSLTLLSFDRVKNPNAEDRNISLRGLIWIVTPVDVSQSRSRSLAEPWLPGRSSSMATLSLRP
jgi:hypothetical protein